MEPERLFFHPSHAVERYHSAAVDLVSSRSEDGHGTRLRVVESGFDKLPAHRRDIAFRSNEGGWTIQMQNIAQYLDQHA
jgi:hypothetical protein